MKTHFWCAFIVFFCSKSDNQLIQACYAKAKVRKPSQSLLPTGIEPTTTESQDNFEEIELEIGEPFNDYEYNGTDRVLVNVSLLMYYNYFNSPNKELDIIAAYNGTVKLNYKETYDFDNGSTIRRMQFDNNRKQTHSTTIIIRQSYKQKDTNYRTYYFKADEDLSLTCTGIKGQDSKELDSLHWIKVKDSNIAEVLKSAYGNKPLIINEKLTQKYDGVELICFNFECNEDVGKKELKCIRDIPQHIKLKLCSENCTLAFKTVEDGSTPTDTAESNENNDGSILGGIAGLGVIVLVLLAAVAWYCWRKAKVKGKQNVVSTVQYIEVEFSDAPSTSSRLKTQDEIIYSKVEGVLYPASKHDGFGPSDNQSIDRRNAGNSSHH